MLPMGCRDQEVSCIEINTSPLVNNGDTGEVVTRLSASAYQQTKPSSIQDKVYAGNARTMALQHKIRLPSSGNIHTVSCAVAHAHQQSSLIALGVPRLPSWH